MNFRFQFIKRLKETKGMGQVITVTVGLIILCLAFGIINPHFFSGRNIANLLRQIAPILLIGIGQSYVMITGNIDLSIGSVVGMSTMISATLMTKGVDPALAVLIALVCCLLIGVLNGILVAGFKLPSFIATLGTMTIGRGIAQIANNNYNTNSIGEAAEGFRHFFYYGSTLGIYNTIWIALILWAFFDFILRKTKSGRHIYAVGSNTEAAKLSGVGVLSTTVKVYTVSAFCSCVVGLIQCATSGMGAMDAGLSYEMYAVAASVIGGVSTLGGQGLLLGTVAGAAIWGVLQNGLQFAGAPVAIRNIVIGIIVIFSVLLDIIVRMNSGKKLSVPFIGQISLKLSKTKKFVLYSVSGLLIIVTGIGTALAFMREKETGGNKVFLITMDQMDQHWVKVSEGAAAAAAESDIIDFEWIAPDIKDDNKQIECINNAVAAGAKVILIAANGPDAVTAALKQADEQGVKIIYVDSAASYPAEQFLATDNRAGGRKVGETLLAELKRRGIRKGSVGIIGVNSATQSTVSREEGFRKTFEGTPYKVLETQYCLGDVAVAKDMAANFITQGCVAVYGSNEGSTVGVGNAVAESRHQAIGCGSDVSDMNKTLIRNGSLFCIMAQNPYKIGYLGMKSAEKLLKGESLSPDYVDTGVEILTKESPAIRQSH